MSHQQNQQLTAESKQLLDLAILGSLDEEYEEQFNQLIKNPHARAYYHEQMEMQAVMESHYVATRASTAENVTLFQHYKPAIYSAAAVVAIGLVSLSVFKFVTSADAPAAQQSLASYSIISQQSPQWLSEQPAENALVVGQSYQLEKGSVVVKSPAGATVTIYQDTSFTLNTENSLSLEQGKVFAHTNGAKFAIKTGQLDIQNMGTSYGVHCADGLVNIAVASGQVSASPAGATGNQQIIKANESLNYHIDDGSFENVIFDENAYPAITPAKALAVNFDNTRLSKGMQGAELYGASWVDTYSKSGTIMLDPSPVRFSWLSSLRYVQTAVDLNTAEDQMYGTHIRANDIIYRDIEDEEAATMYHPNDGYGVSFKLQNMQPWLKRVGASSYTITLYMSSYTNTTPFEDVDVFSSWNGEESLLHTISAATQPFSSPGLDNPRGQHARFQSENLTEDEVVVRLKAIRPGEENYNNLSGVMITPHF
ncbi:FecR domain-containing protein [Persicirhabdus sediminis]|uniref:FecR domain-containing protein n=1 Tax=Persicirhabdus sediminis TaxID=454144 RepID=A0A8J7MB70_9BACT|nr:FecR domain-containing protein [Persicirhabdus sediminis]MBK1789897.1 FecR domain-containing protein [Persicirhabdus sediminis]